MTATSNIPDLGRFHNHLLRNHTSLTKSRDLIYAQFWHTGPCTIKAIASALKDVVGQATVYRTVARFLKLGIIYETSSNKLELTDRFIQHHHYFTCRVCLHQISFNDEALEKVLSRLADRRRLTLEDHHIGLSGLCSLCAAKTPARDAIGTNLRRIPG